MPLGSRFFQKREYPPTLRVFSENPLPVKPLYHLENRGEDEGLRPEALLEGGREAAKV